ncbi:MAG: peptidylprolyl isomerase [Candidatus Aenigmarchaeota archaeon]|nr:peptidylprolyl isomerase [Candidatus Aenigmarchaeota archaeon]
MKKGDFVRINFIGRIKDTGEIFDLTYEDIAKKEGIYNEKVVYRPVPIVIGEGFVIKGLDDALLEMNVGEKKKIVVKPDKGFGQRKPDLVKVFPMTFFEEQKINPKPGMVVDFSGMKGKVQSIDGGRVRVDFNNPLAGRELEYEMEIVEKIEKPEEKVKAIFEYFGIDAKVKIDKDTAEVEAYVPLQLKSKIISLVLKYCGVKRLKLIEVYELKNESPSSR